VYDFKSAEEAEWVLLPEGEWSLDFDAAALPPDQMLLEADSQGFYPIPVSPSLPSGWALGVAAVEADALMLVGGSFSGSSSDEIRIVDLDEPMQEGVQYVLADKVGPRFGASVVHDWVTRSTYLMGGAGGSLDLRVVRPADGVVANAHSGFVTRDVEVSFEVVSTSGPAAGWTVRTVQGMRVGHRCQAPERTAIPRLFGEYSSDPNDSTLPDACYADTLEIDFHTPYLADGLTVEVRADQTQPWHPVTFTNQVLPGQLSRTTISLQRTLLDEDSVDVRVSFSQKLKGVAQDERFLSLEETDGWRRTLVGSTPATGALWLSHTGLPARVRTSTAAWDPTGPTRGGAPAPAKEVQELVNVTAVTVLHPDGWVTATPMEVAPCDTIGFELADLQPVWGFPEHADVRPCSPAGGGSPRRGGDPHPGPDRGSPTGHASGLALQRPAVPGEGAHLRHPLSVVAAMPGGFHSHRLHPGRRRRHPPRPRRLRAQRLHHPSRGQHPLRGHGGDCSPAWGSKL
jgi:hypothetical protein